MEVFMVEPSYELEGPLSGLVQGGECRRDGGVVFQGAERGFGVRVVVADPWSGVGRSDAKGD